ncbi:MAG: SGNH/GDSL hydrolase family protein, partial [Alphaproteobacteria bacterium]|nr:SGNH/GDSL hydrolase family protein [Alphaproteobacteria bacterium]
MNRFERHPVLTLAAVVVLALVALLAALEALLAELESGQIVLAGENALAPPRFVRLREYQPDTTFTFAPPAARLATPGGPVAPSYTIATDVDGFIAPSRVHALADLTIAFLGGSTTETMFVAPENRFPFLVGRLLEQRLGIRVNSLNAAKSGNNTLHSIIVLTAKLLPLRPDFVLLTHNMNDLGVLATYGSYWNDSKDYAPVVQSAHGIEAAFRGLRDALIPRTYRAVKRLVRRPAPPAA